MRSDGEYLLGMEPAEVERLGRQHEAWGAATERVLDAAGIGPGATVVDLGCGPGFTTLELAARVAPGGRVVAVDSSDRAIAELGRRLDAAGVGHVEVVRAAATEFDPSPWAPDVLFARWLFCYLSEPEELVTRLAGRLAPGARLAVMDYWNYRAIRAEPLTPLFRRVFEAVERSFAASGGSLDVAGRLPVAFERAGLDLERVVPIVELARPGEPLWRWVEEFLELYLPTLVRSGALEAGELAAHRREWAERASIPGALLFLPPVLGVVGIRRPG